MRNKLNYLRIYFVSECYGVRNEALVTSDMNTSTLISFTLFKPT